jgi:hypothetical protein
VTTILVAALSCAVDEEEWQQELAPGIRKGAALVEKSLVLADAPCGEVADMALGRVGADEREYLILAGRDAVLLLDPDTRRVERTVPLARVVPEPLSDTPNVRILDVDGDGRFEFARMAAHWFGRTSLHRPDGSAVWSHPSRPSDPKKDDAPNFTLCGDVTGDGRLEFLMGLNFTGEMHLLDTKGALLMSQSWGRWVTGAMLVDVDRDGAEDIVYIDGEELCARNSRGDVLARARPPGGAYVNHLSLVEGFGDPATDWFLVGGYTKKGPDAGQSYYLVPPGTWSFARKVTREEVEAYIDAVSLAFEPEASPKFAKIDRIARQAFPAGFDATRLKLRLFDAARLEVYEERLAPPHGDTARTDGVVLALRSRGERPASFLVAYGTSVYEYVLRPAVEPK